MFCRFLSLRKDRMKSDGSHSRPGRRIGAALGIARYLRSLLVFSSGACEAATVV